MLLEQLAESGAFAPNLRHMEVGNVLFQEEKRERVNATQITARLELPRGLPIYRDTETASRAFREAASLSRHLKFSTCDAYCLELAMLRSLPLAKQDKAPILAADAAQIKALPESSHFRNIGFHNFPVPSASFFLPMKKRPRRAQMEQLAQYFAKRISIEFKINVHNCRNPLHTS